MILNLTDHITKMATILDDTTTFLKLYDSSLNDTHKLEIKLQKQFLEFFKKIFISREFYDQIRPIASQRPRMNGFTKIHKSGVPLGPILSICHSAQHALAICVIQLLNPVLEFYSEFCVGDSFSFASIIHQLPPCVDSQFLVYFDIASLFTNVPLVSLFTSVPFCFVVC